MRELEELVTIHCLTHTSGSFHVVVLVVLKKLCEAVSLLIIQVPTQIRPYGLARDRCVSLTIMASAADSSPNFEPR